MSKEAWISKEVQDELMRLALKRPYMPNKKIESKGFESELRKTFSNPAITIPKLSTITRKVREFRKEAKANVQEQPWSLAMMAKSETGIPWKAVAFLLSASDELQHLQAKGEKLWPASEHPLDDFDKGSLEEVSEILASGKESERTSVRPLAPRAPLGTVLTNRQAKWLWRLRLIFPKVKLFDLLPHVDAYAQRELLADYLNRDFDTSDLDSSLRNIMYDITIHGYYLDRSQENERGRNKK
jgi:hypothetical protein